MQVFRAELGRVTADDRRKMFPGFVFSEPPATVACWYRPSDGIYRLAEPNVVHVRWDPTIHGPNLEIECRPAEDVVVCVVADETSVTSLD